LKSKKDCPNNDRKLLDLLEQNKYILYKGNCFDFMKTLPAASIDCVITDPPYGVMKISQSVFRPNMTPLLRDVGWDSYDDTQFYALMESLSNATKTICKEGSTSYVFCSEDLAYLVKKAYETSGWLWRMLNIWHKNNPAPVVRGANRPQKATEGIGLATIGKKNKFYAENMGRCHNVFEYPIVHHFHREHPTQKPVKLMREIIERCSDVGDVIFDPFMGVGSTGVACVELGRYFVGCELEDEYFPIAERRLMAAVAGEKYVKPKSNG
jgi:DNA modification methylase